MSSFFWGGRPGIEGGSLKCVLVLSEVGNERREGATSKSSLPGRVTGVRIPPSPPNTFLHIQRFTPLHWFPINHSCSLSRPSSPAAMQRSGIVAR